MRKSYLDNIRWATVVVVVLYHVFYCYNAEGVMGGLQRITDLEVQYYDLFVYIVYPWMMPILYIVSGISARHALEKYGAREFIRRRTVRLLVPSTIGPFVFNFIQGYVNMSIGGAFETMGGVPAPVKYLIMVASGISVLWYIQLLWVFSMALVLIRKLDRGRLWALGAKANPAFLFATVVPVWIVSHFLNTPVVVVYRFGLYGLLFLLGYFVFSHDEVIDLVKRWFPVFLPLAAGLCVAFCAVYFGKNYADAPVNCSPLFTAYCWFGCLAILGGAARYADFQNDFTRWMGRRSFGLYVFHYLGISSVALFVGKSGRLPAAAVYLLSGVAGFAVGYLLNAVVSRIPMLRWCVLGIEKEGTHVQG